MKQFTTTLPLALLISVASLSTYADSGIYGDVFVGSSSYEVDAVVSGTLEGENFLERDTFSTDNTTSYGLRVGYQFIDFIAIELGYSEFGEADNTFIDDFDDTITQRFGLTAVTLGVKGILPLTNNFSLNARLGMASWDFSAEFQDSSVPGEVENLSKSGEDLYYGVGMEYSFSNSFYTGLEYSITNFDWSERDLEGFSSKIEGENSNIALSVGFKF